MTIVAIANALLDGVMRDALPRRADRAGDRAAAAGAHAARRRGRAIRGPRKSSAGATVARSRSRARAAPAQPARRRARTPPAVERPLRGDGDGGRLGLQPLATIWPSRAGARTPRATTGAATSSCATSRAARSGRPATSRAACEPDSYDVMFAEDRAEIHPPRRQPDHHRSKCVVSPEDDAEVRRVSLTNRGPRGARDRAHLLCRARARAAGGRRRPSGLLQAVRARPSIVPGPGALLATRRRRAPGRAGGLGRASRGGRRRGDRRRRVRDRPRALPRPRPRRSRDAVAVIDGRALSNTVGTVLDPVFALRRRLRVPAGRHGAHRVLDHGRADSRDAAARPRRQASRRQRLRARRDAGLDAGQVQLRHLGIESDRGEPVPAAGRARPVRRSALRPSSDAIRRGAGAASRRSGRRASRATCRSCWCASTTLEDVDIVRAAAARPRILADEAAGGRPGDPQRARRLVRAGPADRARDPGAHSQSPAHACRRGQLRAACSSCAPT